jgi:glycerol-3-phosphate dehydrogenase
MHDNMQEKMIKAEVWFAINYEMACNPTDFFMRRTGRLFFDAPSVSAYKNFVLNEFQNAFSWDKETTKIHEIELEHHLKMATTFM